MNRNSHFRIRVNACVVNVGAKVHCVLRAGDRKVLFRALNSRLGKEDGYDQENR